MECYQTSSSITWSTETFAQNQNANAIRFGTLYNFRFDADQAPNPTNATVGYFKTGGPMPALIQAPGGGPTPSPTPTPTATPTATPTMLRPQLRSHRPRPPLLLPLPRLLLRQHLQHGNVHAHSYSYSYPTATATCDRHTDTYCDCHIRHQHLLRAQLRHRGLFHRRVRVPLPCRARKGDDELSGSVAAP